MIVTQPPPEYKSLDIKIPKLEAWVVDSIRAQAAASPQKTMTGYISELLRAEAMRKKRKAYDMITKHLDKMPALPAGTMLGILRSIRDDEDNE